MACTFCLFPEAPIWFHKAVQKSKPNHPLNPQSRTRFPQVGGTGHISRDAPSLPSTGAVSWGTFAGEWQMQKGGPEKPRGLQEPLPARAGGTGFGDRQFALFQRASLSDAGFAHRAACPLWGVALWLGARPAPSWEICGTWADPSAPSCSLQALGTHSSQPSLRATVYQSAPPEMLLRLLFGAPAVYQTWS